MNKPASKILSDELNTSFKRHSHNPSKESMLDFMNAGLRYIENNPNISNKKSLRAFNDISMDKITEIIQLYDSLNEERHDFLKYIWNSKVAERSEIQADFDYLLDEKHMFATNDCSLLSFVLAVQGHSENGHGQFRSGNPCPNTQTNHILNAVAEMASNNPILFQGQMYTEEYFNPKTFRLNVQKQIDNSVAVYEQFLRNPYQKYMTLPKNTDLFGLIFPFDITIDVLEGLRGFFYGGNFDTYNPIRKTCDKRYGYNMGGGSVLIGKTKNMKTLFYGLNEFSGLKYEHLPIFAALNQANRIQVMKNLGVIYDQNVPDLTKLVESENKILSWKEVRTEFGLNIFNGNTDYDNFFVRNKNGRGVSDDLAIWNSGILPPTFRGAGYADSKYALFSRILQSALVDRVDTYEKASGMIFQGGQDGFISDYLNANFKILCKDKKFRDVHNIKLNSDGSLPDLVDQDTIVDYTIMSANLDEIIHSSMRYFGKLQKHNSCILKELFNCADKVVSNTNYFTGANIPKQLLSRRIQDGLRIGFHNVPYRHFLTRIADSVQTLLPEEGRSERVKKYFDNYLTGKH